MFASTSIQLMVVYMQHPVGIVDHTQCTLSVFKGGTISVHAQPHFRHVVHVRPIRWSICVHWIQDGGAHEWICERKIRI